MSLKRWCDATQRLQGPDEHFEEFGWTLKRHYSEEPAAVVKEYLAGIDELHTRLAAEFHAQRTELRDALLREWPKIYLPDETDESTEKRIAEMAPARKKTTRKKS